MNTTTLPPHRDGGLLLHTGDPALPWPARLRAALAADSGELLLLASPGLMPDAADLRLLHEALTDLPEFDAISPADAAEVRATWALEAGEEAAAFAWSFAPHQALPGPLDPRCALWRRSAAERLLREGPQARLASARLPHLALELGPPLPGLPPLLRRGWCPSGRVRRRPIPTRAGRDGRPVILHVLHDWGGGVERFVRDQMRHDGSATHLALLSRGREGRAFGESLALYADLDAPPLRVWACEPAVGDMAIRHPGVAAALSETLASFGVSALRVSSLIGSSLDVLRTGLPTAFVLHDAFPFWPLLDDAQPQPVFDPERLRTGLATPGHRFRERDPAIWQVWSEAAIMALDAPGIALVAPSRAAVTRLQALLPTALHQRIQVLPHGLALDTSPRSPKRRPGPLRVLVPGRLTGSKGERLLEALLPIAPRGIDWCLAGGGALAESLVSRFGGQAVPDYVPESLPELIREFDPDLALLPSLLPETFGYVLSEMQALGVPVLAAAVGAYAERLAGAPEGLRPLPSSASAFAAALAHWVAQPEALPRTLPAPPRLSDSLAAWQRLHPLAPSRPRTRPADPVALLQHEQGMLMGLAGDLAEERDEAYRAYDRDTTDLIRQRDVAVSQGHALMQEINQVRQHAERLGTELEAARCRVLAVEQEAEQRARRSIERPIDGVEAEARRLAEERDRAYAFYERDTADLIRQRDVALAQRDAAQAELARLQAIVAHPWVRWPRQLRRRLADALLVLRYHALHGLDLGRRGLRSLRQRGLAATLAAARRRFLGSPTAAAENTTPAVEAPLCFPHAASPLRASIVIPVHGKLDFTLACLRSLIAAGLGDEAEVIVVDDASPDASPEVLPRIPGLRYHRNRENLGFVGSCNAGAALARGDYLVFLNNDTTVRPGWLTALLATFEQHPDTGLAGALLVYPDGRLQESGGIVFSDGSGWNYGRFEDPRHPAYTFVREADYCSGAAIALPRTLFQRLGGFDERYAPAYYEDTDLAMKVREAGLKVRVQPAAVVVHHEGVTAGTDTASGVKAYQVRNQQRFLEHWREVLQRRHPSPTQAPHYAAQHRARARVLVIDATTPMPDRDSGSVRLFELLRLLVEEGCAVSFFPENGLDDGPYTQALRRLGVEAWTQPWLGSVPDWLAKHGARFQLIIVSRHYVLSPLLPLLRRHAPQARIVFDTVDLHHLRELREAEERRDPALKRHAERTREAELALMRSVDRTWVVSPVEQALLARELPQARVDVVSNIHRVRGRGPGMTTRSGLLFVGGYRHPPNVDAALWLANDILPRLRAVRPDIHLSLVGSEAPPEVLALGERDGIRVHGHVPDLVPLLDAHRFSVAPLRYGAGVKGKVNQALAHGLPVVATPCAVEGMGLSHGVDVLVADDAESFAATLLAAYEDEPLWERLVAGGLANTEREFSPERARQTLRAIFSELR